MKNELCWKVYCYELSYVGRPKLLEQNVFSLNWPLNAQLYKLRNCKDKKEFEKQLDRELMSELWSRCEYEIYITDMFEDSEQYKVDVYNQIKMNWDIFVDYCWEHRKLFRKFKDSHRHMKEVRKYWRSVK